MNPYIITGLRIYQAKEPPRITQANKIITTVSNYFKIDPKLLQEKTRKSEIVFARQLCIYFILLYTRYSQKEIGEMFGGRDHTTIIHSRKKIQDLMYVDDEVKKIVLHLSDALQPRRLLEDLLKNNEQ